MQILSIRFSTLQLQDVSTQGARLRALHVSPYALNTVPAFRQSYDLHTKPTLCASEVRGQLWFPSLESIVTDLTWGPG